MNPIGTRHLACAVALNHLLVASAGSRYFVSVQNPVSMSSGDEPQPDLSLLKTRPRPDADAPPGPKDILLLVEVSDTTLAYDRTVKLCPSTRVRASQRSGWRTSKAERSRFTPHPPREGATRRYASTAAGTSYAPEPCPISPCPSRSSWVKAWFGTVEGSCPIGIMGFARTLPLRLTYRSV